MFPPRLYNLLLLVTLMSCHGISLNLSLIVEATESDNFLVYSSKPLLSNFSKKGKMTVDQSRTQYKIFTPPPTTPPHPNKIPWTTHYQISLDCIYMYMYCSFQMSCYILRPLNQIYSDENPSNLYDFRYTRVCNQRIAWKYI